jgi:hypothetical protein
MKTLGLLLLGIGLFFTGFQIRDHLVLEQAASKAKQDLRDAFNIGVVEGSDAEGNLGGYWPRDAEIPEGALRNYAIKGTAIEIKMGTYPDQVLLYCYPVYGRELLIVLYDNGTVGEMIGAPPPFTEEK